MPLNEVRKQIVQRLITTTADNILYRPLNAFMTTYIKTIIVCNTTAATKTYSIWVNQNGAVSGDQFALMKTVSIAANASDQLLYPGDNAIILTGSTAAILVNASVANALTFTLYGSEVVET